MKLIELLARELKEWPSDKAVIVVQDGDMGQTIKFGGAGCEPSVAGFGNANVWQAGEWNCPARIDFNCRELADDWRTAIVTRAEWEATQAAPSPTLETMLTEWRDLEARAQAAQAEADALFEHAGQCHGEIVVRLAELGWGAPRGPVESVVTLDDELPTNVTRYDLRVGDVIQLTGCDDNKAWRRYAGLHATVVELPAKVEHPEGDGTWLLCDSTEFVFISRPSAQQ